MVEVNTADEQLRNDGDDDEVERADQRDAGQHIVDEVRGALAGTDAGDEAAVLAHVVGDVIGTEDDGDVEVREEDDRDHLEQLVPRLAGSDGAEDRAEERSCRCSGCSRTSAAPAKSSGADRIELAKMTGITPPELTFSGRCVDWPPIILRPTMRLAYWTGMRRSERSTKTMKATTAIMPTIRMSDRDGASVLPRRCRAPSRRDLRCPWADRRRYR